LSIGILARLYSSRAEFIKNLSWVGLVDTNKGRLVKNEVEEFEKLDKISIELIDEVKKTTKWINSKEELSIKDKKLFSLIETLNWNLESQTDFN